MPYLLRKNALQPSSEIKISDGEFHLLSALIYRHFGINLTQKKTLLKTRLQNVLRQGNFRSFRQFYDYVLANPAGRAMSELVNAISTNHTYFYREKEHFDFLSQTALPEITARLRQEQSKDLRLWCAGCSTGEEAYMLVMMMMEFLGPEYPLWKAGTLATDISEKALKRARIGRYTKMTLASLPEAFRTKYFARLPDGLWEVKEHVKREVTLRRFNLMTPRFPFNKPFEIIFCRNVMIYFDVPTIAALLGRFHQSTALGGYLIISHSESLGRENKWFSYVKPGVYKKK